MDLLNDTAQIEKVESELNILIERRTTARDRANAESYEEREKQRRRLEKQREEHRLLWADYYSAMAETHALLAGENQRRARSLLEEDQNLLGARGPVLQ